MESSFPLVPTSNFVVFILVLLSLSKGVFHANNIGTCSFAVWVAILNLKTAINASVWSNNVEDRAPVWCDITTRIDTGSVIALPAASFVIIRRLSIMIRRGDNMTAKEKKMDFIVDSLLCIGFPVVQMALYYIAQTNRYQIIEEGGCINAIGSFGLELLMMEVAPVLLPLISLVLYSPRLILKYYRINRDPEATVSEDGNLSRNRFIQLLALGLFDIFITLPFQTLDLVLIISQNEVVGFWPGWQAIHADFSTIPTATTDEWKADGFWTIFNVRFYQWINPIYGVAFFLIFGLTETKRAWYRSVFWKTMKPLGLKPHVDTVVSSMNFGSGPAVNSDTDGIHATVMTNESIDTSSSDSSALAQNEALGNRAKLEGNAYQESFGTKTEFLSRSNENFGEV